MTGIVRQVLNSPFDAQCVVTSTTLAGGTPVADAQLTLTITKPNGTTTTVANGSLTVLTTGFYSYTYLPTAVGLYLFKFAGSYGGWEGAVEVVDTTEVM